MVKPIGKQAIRNTQGAEAASVGASTASPAAGQEPFGQENAELTAAQKEYLENMRISVQQMKEGDTRPLSDLLEELGAEPMGNDQAHQDD